jgi:hypothetical protein
MTSAYLPTLNPSALVGRDVNPAGWSLLKSGERVAKGDADERSGLHTVFCGRGGDANDCESLVGVKLVEGPVHTQGPCMHSYQLVSVQHLSYAPARPGIPSSWMRLG